MKTLVGALALWKVPIEDSNFMHRSIVIDEVRCDSTETKLLDCSHKKRGFRCRYGGDASVRCTDKLLQVKNITAATVPVQESCSNVTRQSILLSWELHSNASYTPSSFLVQCINQQHHYMELSVNNGTLTWVNIGDIFSSTIFDCCVSAIYYRGHYATERQCTITDSDMFLLDLSTTQVPNQTLNQPVTTPSSTQMISASIGSEKVISSDLNMRASIISGVLGSIIIILLLLLAICGGALLFLLQSRSMTPKT